MFGGKAGVHSVGGALAVSVRMWFSLAVFGIFAWSADAAMVDAGSLTSISTEALLYDTSLSSANGCDPSGCVGDLTRDGDLTNPQSRWSCKPELGAAGSTCSITYSLGIPLALEGLNIAMYKGNERARTMDIYIDGVLVTSWTSSGATLSFETVDLDITGQSVELRGVLSDAEWLSLMEVMILVDNGEELNTVEAGTLGTVTTSASLYDTNVAAENGCDPAGCAAALTRDGDMNEGSRWSCAPRLGGDCSISYNLGAVRDLAELRLALYKGATRTTTVEIYVDDAVVATWTSSGTTDGFESIYLAGVTGEVIKIAGVLENSEWLSIIEAEILVLTDDELPTGTLEPVGPTPLAVGPYSYDWDNAYYIKDGDFSTSWFCDVETQETRRCDIHFRLVYYRRLKYVKIALANGADGPVEMRIGNLIAGQPSSYYVTVMSSGTNDDFETYEIDLFTDFFYIEWISSGEGSISISEVEFMEEIQPEQVPVANFYPPYDIADGLEGAMPTTDGFEWWSNTDDVLDEVLIFNLGILATVTRVELQFPVGETYMFDLQLFNGLVDWQPFATITDLESMDTEGWQSFQLGVDADQIVTGVNIVMKGTGSGTPGFYLLDARFFGSPATNPTDTFSVGSTRIPYWISGTRYPDFVAEGTGDQKAIMGAICAVKRAAFDGVDCVGADPTATGTVKLSFGDFYLDGNIFLKSGVFMIGEFSNDDSPNTTNFYLEHGAAGNTDVDAVIVVDGVSHSRIDGVWIRGLYDPDADEDVPAVDGFGSTCISITNSENITLFEFDIRFCDGDALVVRDSNVINIDAGRFDEDEGISPFTIGRSRGTGLLVDKCDAVWVRRHAMWDNGIAGIHIADSNNFTFVAEIDVDYSEAEGEGFVGSLDGQQPIEVIVESSSLVTFQDMKVSSVNEPVMTVSADSSRVTFNNLGLSDVESGLCVILMGDPSVVTAVDDELTYVDGCLVKV